MSQCHSLVKAHPHHTDATLTKPTGDVIERSFLFRLIEYIVSFAVFYEFTEIHEGCIVRDTYRLLHVMGDNRDRIIRR